MSSEAIITLVVVGLCAIIGGLAWALKRQEVKHVEEKTDLEREVQIAKLAEDVKDAETKESDYRVASDRYSQFRAMLRQRELEAKQRQKDDTIHS